uniref:Uncharacterized protein n=1 Tax=Arundo donax TaxID=35708 RepID=A0A0A9HJW1_ARUDO
MKWKTMKVKESLIVFCKQSSEPWSTREASKQAPIDFLEIPASAAPFSVPSPILTRVPVGFCSRVEIPIASISYSLSNGRLPCAPIHPPRRRRSPLLWPRCCGCGGRRRA